MKKTVRFFALALCAMAVFAFLGCSKKVDDKITIGGIFPLSGGVAVYGVEIGRAHV